MTSQEKRVAELYTLPPDEFTAARDRLAKELRDGGEKDEAAEVKKLRRPTVAAWALNRAAREKARLVRDLLAASDELRRVQSGGAGSAKLKEASTGRRRAVERLGAAAKDVLGDAGDAHEEDITQTLLAAATDQGVRERLRTGTLERAAAPTANFEDLGSLLAAAPSVGAPALQRERQRTEKLDAQATDAEDEAERLDDEAREAEHQAERLRREVAVAERAAAEARRRAERAASKAETARSRADEAAAGLRELEGSSR